MKKNKTQKKKVDIYGIITRTVIITIISLLCAVLIVPIFKDTNLGLELAGGFEVLYEVEGLNGEEVTSDMMSATYKTMIKRIDILGVLEPEISIEGDNRIRIRLAGIEDEDEARTVLNTVASLSFRDANDKLLMSSDVLNAGGASVQYQNGLPVVSLSIKDTKTFYNVTKEVSTRENGENLIVIWLDFEEGVDSYKNETSCNALGNSHCISAATVSSAFSSDVVIQSSAFTKEEVQTLVELINSGSLPTKLNELQSTVIGASFGSDSLNKTAIAGIIGVLLIMIFLTLMYHFSGFITSLSVIVYSLLVFFTFWLIGGTLTFPGIAAIVLGIGMAIDANIISMERIKEELYQGKSLKTAFENGNKNSLSSILDANITTLIVAIILFIFSESSVKGFATMLIINIVVTLLVMVVIDKKILKMFVNTGFFDERINSFIKINKKKIGNVEVKTKKYVKSRTAIISAFSLLIVAGTVFMITSGFNLGLEYKGGTSIDLKVNNNITTADVNKYFEETDYKINKVTKTKDGYSIVLDKELDKEESNTLISNLEKEFNAKTEINVISNIVKKELTLNAIYSVLLSLIGIIIYITIRYRFSYAISAIIALFHDIFVVFLVFSIFKLEITSIFVAAVLAVLGYSINGTIVAFDRIRENLNMTKGKVKSKEELENVINLSVSQMFKRSMFTSITTLLPVLSLVIFGTSEIINFNIALLVGISMGTYSSLFIATSLWYVFNKKNIGKNIVNRIGWDSDKQNEFKVKGVND